MKIASLYMLTAPSGKSYIGVTAKKLKYRIGEHVHAKTTIGRALRKYGDLVRSRVLAVGSEEYIYDLERKAISAFGTMGPAGYNCKEGGYGGRHTEESKRKISEGNRGKVVSAEGRRRIGAASIGRVHSTESRAKMSAAQKKRFAEGRGFLPDNSGPMSAEQKRKISEGQKRRWSARRMEDSK